MKRTILHSDMNGFYASVECLYHPELRNKPVAVAGDPEARHGIVLAKNELAKKFGIKTGNPLWMARQICPDIVFLPPDFKKYMKFSELAREIYSEYTDRVEPFGLDEAWLDVSGSSALFGDGKTIADSIRDRIRTELGVTVSVGVSFNKVFAKLGSDMKKPDATTVITENNFREKVWRLPVGDLIFVGRASQRKLSKYGIFTIGALANADLTMLKTVFGKAGEAMWRFANGLDESVVALVDNRMPVKSIGNSTTTPRDLTTLEEVKITLKALAESVSARLREQGFVCRTVQLGIRDCELNWIERQCKLVQPDRTEQSLLSAAMELFAQNHDFSRDGSIRSLSIKACDLEKQDFEQLSFFQNAELLKKEERLEQAMDTLRVRFGFETVKRGIMMKDSELSDLDAKNDHIIHPVGFI